MRPRYFPSFSKWDTDRDGKVTQKEFDDALQRNSMAAGWDEDGDGQLSDMEFATGFYWTWDLDGDGSVDRREYDSGCGAFFPSPDTYGTFDQYDADGDGRLSLDEFAALTSKVYPKWDRDGNRKLTERELQAAWYHTWDVNADGLLEHSEYRWN